MRIIPAIDLINGQCVRLTKGNYNTKVIYHADPVEMAKKLEDSGFNYLHLVDLDGAKAKQIKNVNILNRIASETDLTIDFGGGIKSENDLTAAFENGANQVTIGSLAANQPELFLKWLQDYGAHKIILGADANHGKIATMGWQTSTDIEVVDYIKTYVKKGVCNVICTDIQKDGMLKGPAFNLYQQILKESQLNLIASGGVSTMADIQKLKDIGCEAVIIGKAIYEGTISLQELSKLC